MRRKKASLAKTQSRQVRKEAVFARARPFVLLLASFAPSRLRERCLCLFLLFAATSAIAAGENSGDAEHLLYLADDGLAVIRLKIDIDGKSHRETCRETSAELCQAADQDGDGFLSADEYQRGVAQHPALQNLQAMPMNRPGQPEQQLDFTATGKRSFDSVIAFLMRTALPPLQLEFSANAFRRISEGGQFSDRPLADERMFDLLDVDGNHKLTSREFERAADVLGRLDFDEDEIISLEELRMRPTPAMAAANANRRPRRSDFHLTHLTPGRIDAQFVRRILSLYDGEAKGTVQDLRLDRQETGLPEELFAKSDADRDGFWDFDELWRFLERPIPMVEIAIHVAADGQSTSAGMSTIDENLARLVDRRPGRLTLEIQGTRMQLAWPRSTLKEANPEQALTAQFQQLDADKNEYLTPEEFGGGTDEEPSPIFRSIDADEDGKIYLADFLSYNARSQQAREQRWTLAVENLERTLFGSLDADADGRLSRRELAHLERQAATWDADGDDNLIEDEIPQQYRLTLTRGTTGTTVRDLPASYEALDTEIFAPLWFRKMDRNRDGEVSPREFLGPLAQFENIDANHDGGIDATEAAAVK